MDGQPAHRRGPAIPWLLDGRGGEVSITLAAIRDSLPQSAVVVPGHGRPESVDGFNFSLGYLGALVEGVEASVAAGVDVDETVQSVTLPDYQGYALWGWIHSAVNVPNTYTELSQ